MKEKIVSALQDIQVSGLLSLSIIGSFNYSEELHSVEDVDIYLIVSKLTTENFQQIKVEFSKAAEKLANEEYFFVTEFRAGPIKPSAISGKKVIQLHVLINEEESIQGKSPMVALDWSMNSRTIQGNDVKNYLKIDSFSSEDLVDGKDGLK